MFDFKCKAELRHINLRAQVEGEEFKRAIDVKLMLLDVPLDKCTSLLPDWKQLYRGANLVLQEIIPFPVHHKLESLKATIGGHKFEVCDVKKMSRCWPLPSKHANIFVSVQVSEFSDAALAWLSKNQRETIEVSFAERQLSAVPEMQQS